VARKIKKIIVKTFNFLSFFLDLSLIYLDSTTAILKQINPIEPLEIQIPPKLFPSTDIESILPIQSENVSYHKDKKITCASFVLYSYLI
jgi:hypothetical protein